MTIADVVQRTVPPQKQNEERGVDGSMARWLRWLNGQIKPEYMALNRWPR